MNNETVKFIRKKNLDLIQKLIKIGKSLSLENDIKIVFKIILDEVIDLTSADRGVIYITADDQKSLLYERIKINSKNLELDADTASKRFKPIQLFSDNDEIIMNSLATFVYHTGFEAHFDDIYQQDFTEIQQIIVMDKRDNYKSKSMVALPMIDHEENVLGIIELTNSANPDGEIIPFNDDYIDILLSIASQAAITLSNKVLIRNLEKMIFDFTQAIAYAIDMKSDKSYQHVQKVALLTNRLAKEINLVSEGVFSDKHFSDDQLDEIAISGWLHDLGKIATSECLLNKNTKLLKSCDRLKYIQTRFDLVEQVIINKLKLNSLSPIRKTELETYLDSLPHKLDLIKKLNVGSESISDDVIEKLKNIAEFSIEFDGKKYQLLEDDELENLLIKRGTLTSSEYEEIKKHAELTYRILSNITFPAKFRDVPKIAASHHERLNGSGYPLGLKEDQIPIQSRILAIADVFDALMSKRSYKEGYGLESSLKILASMANNNEIDQDLMDIILDNEVYKDFAQHYNIDDFSMIDIKKIKDIYKG